MARPTAQCGCSAHMGIICLDLSRFLITWSFLIKGREGKGCWQLGMEMLASWCKSLTYCWSWRERERERERGWGGGWL